MIEVQFVAVVISSNMKVREEAKKEEEFPLNCTVNEKNFHSRNFALQQIVCNYRPREDNN